mgnify:CR=1 FL=1
MVGLYNGEYFARFSTQDISEDELIAIQKTANDNLYSMYAWKIGHVTGAGYEFYIENPKKKWYFLNVGHGPFTLEKGMFKERYTVYQYTNGMFVSSGRIQYGYFYRNHHLLIQFISSVFKIVYISSLISLGRRFVGMSTALSIKFEQTNESLLTILPQTEIRLMSSCWHHYFHFMFCRESPTKESYNQIQFQTNVKGPLLSNKFPLAQK